MKKILLLFSVMLVSYGSILAQRTVTGKVTDPGDGSPLPGVNILEKGTNNGTVTDIDGNYSISVNDNATLIFSFIGYKNQEVVVGSQSTINLELESDITQLSEVVVIGYGEIEAKDATGSVTTIKPEDFNQGVIASPEQLIQGRTAGVQITGASGEPGAGSTIRIRGNSSIRSGNGPLFVVDGVPLSGGDVTASGQDVSFGTSSARNPLNFINPNDIASIDILKDASATAIYGSRGANGVVIITTKSGKGKKPTLDYSALASFSKVAQEYDLLEPDAYLAGAAALGADANALDMGSETDWQDEIFRTGISQSHNLSYGGGAGNGDFRVSLSYFDQEGIIEESGLKRYTARFNGSQNFFDDKLRVSGQFTLADIRDENVPITNNSGFEGDLIGAMISANPTRPVFNPDGSYNQPGTDQLNPVALLALSEDNTKTLRLLGSFSGEYKIIPELSFKTNIGFDRSTSSRKAAYSRDLVANGIAGPKDSDGDGDVDYLGGRASFVDIISDNRLIENYLSYNKELNADSKISAILGYSYQSFEAETKVLNAQNFRTSDLDIMLNNLASVDLFRSENIDDTRQDFPYNKVPLIANTTRTKDAIQSFFGRINYNFMDRYLLTATLRADGSTRFGENNKYGYFPSFAAAWRISDESFAPAVFSDLKLRVGYGITGNQEIPNNQVIQRQRYADFGFNDNGEITGGALGDVAFANPDLKWETTGQLNVGIDYGFVDNRIRGSLEYYYKKTNDLLIQVTSAQPAAQPFVYTNLDADIINKGLEFSVEADAVTSSDFSWTVIANFAYNKNTVENFNSIINTGVINGQGLTGAYAQRIADGQPLFAYFLRDFVGFDENGQSIYADGDFQQFTGDSPLPKLTAGFTNRFGYKNFDLSIFFTGQFGHKIYNNTANAYFTAGALGNGRNVSEEVLSSGESNLNAPDVSTRFLEDGDFVRLENLTLGYNFNVSNVSAINSLRLFMTAQNLFVITDYSGLDPEVNTDKTLAVADGASGVPAGVPSLGIDYTSYPRARTISFGLNVTF
ncbi:TonB-dependent receptor [Fulvivirga ulvae]|uniref:SusC/RagA family TonB-linked outer membrane protein n=1 Tax=Fulvivirga ulvae TaxID=2904245 RepID=UPI001F25D62B|nr:TonB-dependent receptor [Fulvivirga ulvae]UII30790.1 TonB-dependent receptor [Fulvivirga ulvae]